MNREQAEQMNPGDPVTVTFLDGGKTHAKLGYIGTASLYARVFYDEADRKYYAEYPLDWVERACVDVPRRVGTVVEAAPGTASNRELFVLHADGWWFATGWADRRWHQLVDPVLVPADDPRLLLPVRDEDQ